MILLPVLLSLLSTSLHVLAGAGTPAAAVEAPETGLDLALHGLPLQGQTLVLEVRGPAATPFLVRGTSSRRPGVAWEDDAPIPVAHGQPVD
jgi:hypothetical protein